MADELKEAARHLVDKIEHNQGLLGKIIGGIAGFVLGAALVIGVALLMATPIGWAVVGAALTVGAIGIWGGEKIGEAIGEMFNYDAGDILKGSPDTTVGDRTLNAARVEDPVKCHTGKRIAEGCITISINGKPAVRVGHLTECSGKVKEGCKTVLYGGGTIRVLEVKKPGEPFWYKMFKEVVDWAGFIIGLGGLKAAWTGARLAWTAKEAWSVGRVVAGLANTYNVVDTAIWLPKRVVEGKIGDLYEAAGSTAPGWLQKQAFTETDWYRTADGAWTIAGLGVNARDATHSLRGTKGWEATPPTSAPPVVAPAGAPTAPPARAPDPPAAPVGGHPEGRIAPDAVMFDGQRFAQQPSGLYTPDRTLILPPSAQRPSAPIGEGAGALPPAAPRSSGLLGADGLPLPPSAPRTSPAPAPVAADVASPPPTPPPAPTPPKRGFWSEPTPEQARIAGVAGTAGKVQGRADQVMQGWDREKEAADKAANPLRVPTAVIPIQPFPALP